jgi:hypothetical protein
VHVDSSELGRFLRSSNKIFFNLHPVGRGNTNAQPLCAGNHAAVPEAPIPTRPPTTPSPTPSPTQFPMFWAAPVASDNGIAVQLFAWLHPLSASEACMNTNAFQLNKT